MSTLSLTTDPQATAPSSPRRLVLLSGDTAAAVSARRHVVQVMHDGGVDDDTVADVELLVSEVVGNFLRHEAPHEIDVDIAVSRERAVTVVVTGGVSGPSLPLVFGVARPADSSDSGRGLRLLDTLTTTWGTRRRHAATSLWFSVGGDGSAPGSDPGSRTTPPPVSAAQIQQVELSLAVPPAAQDAAYTVATTVFPHDRAAAAALFEASALTAAATSRAGRAARAPAAIARAVATAALPASDTSSPELVPAAPALRLHRSSARLRDAVDEFDCALDAGLALPELVRRDTEVAAASTQCLEAAIACHSRHGG